MIQNICFSRVVQAWQFSARQILGKGRELVGENGAILDKFRVSLKNSVSAMNSWVLSFNDASQMTM